MGKKFTSDQLRENEHNVQVIKRCRRKVGAVINNSVFKLSADYMLASYPSHYMSYINTVTGPPWRVPKTTHLSHYIGYINTIMGPL